VANFLYPHVFRFSKFMRVCNDWPKPPGITEIAT